MPRRSQRGGGLRRTARRRTAQQGSAAAGDDLKQAKKCAQDGAATVDERIAQDHLNQAAEKEKRLKGHARRSSDTQHSEQS